MFDGVDSSYINAAQTITTALVAGATSASIAHYLRNRSEEEKKQITFILDSFVPRLMTHHDFSKALFNEDGVALITPLSLFSDNEDIIKRIEFHLKKGKRKTVLKGSVLDNGNSTKTIDAEEINEVFFIFNISTNFPSKVVDDIKNTLLGSTCFLKIYNLKDKEIGTSEKFLLDNIKIYTPEVNLQSKNK